MNIIHIISLKIWKILKVVIEELAKKNNIKALSSKKYSQIFECFSFQCKFQLCTFLTRVFGAPIPILAI